MFNRVNLKFGTTYVKIPFNVDIENEKQKIKGIFKKIDPKGTDNCEEKDECWLMSLEPSSHIDFDNNKTDDKVKKELIKEGYDKKDIYITPNEDSYWHHNTLAPDPKSTSDNKKENYSSRMRKILTIL